MTVGHYLHELTGHASGQRDRSQDEPNEDAPSQWWRGAAGAGECERDGGQYGLFQNNSGQFGVTWMENLASHGLRDRCIEWP